MKIKFPQPPICEECKEGTATSFSFNERWRFTCDCTSDNEVYHIRFDHIFDSAPATVDWLAHMHEKNWMDWNDFIEMIYRFRKATNSFNWLL